MAAALDALCDAVFSAVFVIRSDLLLCKYCQLWLSVVCLVSLQAITQSDSPVDDDFKSLKADIEAGKTQELLQLDQLHREQRAGRVFAGFQEGQIGFAPTFKVGGSCGGATCWSWIWMALIAYVQQTSFG